MKIQLDNVKRICHGSTHNAFGDTVIFNDHIFICYRAGSDHMSEDGRVIVLQCSVMGKRISQSTLHLPNTDLRDPHFCLDGKTLRLLAHTRYIPSNPKAETVSWFSHGNNVWSGVHFPGPRGWWLWRAQVHKGRSWGIGYLRQANQINLYSGHLRGRMEIVSEAVLSQQKHGLGYPNESDLRFTSDSTLVTVVRRDADSFTAQLGISKPPYRRWQWKDLGVYIGGPAMLLIDDESALVAGRYWDGKTLHTRLWLLEIVAGKLTTLAVLPSGGDNGYPGLSIYDNTLLMSYYSSHIDNQSRMYLATFSLDNENQR